ncbi:translation elongation factor Ts [Alphaproteobacteria bacterium]|nr:translation elongation factor Ts [Alphaproteobacteria bacterium]
MTLSASMVKELREKSGAGMMDCKKALQETDGKMEDAVDWLRKQGLSAVAKKSSRVAAEGLIGITVKDCQGSIIEINSETDFVARNELFQNFVKTCSDLALTCDENIEVLKKMQFLDTGRTVDQELVNNIATIGENMNIRRSEVLEVSEGVVISYVHNSVADGLGRLGVLVALESKADKEKLSVVGKQIAMHIAATSPKSLNIDDLDKRLVDRERQVLVDQAVASGKPKEIAEKMVTGRMQKYFQEVVLNEQTSVIDGESKIKDVVKKLQNEINADVKLTGFKILKLGEGIEVTENDFAAEVAATAGM